MIFYERFLGLIQSEVESLSRPVTTEEMVIKLKIIYIYIYLINRVLFQWFCQTFSKQINTTLYQLFWNIEKDAKIFFTHKDLINLGQKAGSDEVQEKVLLANLRN